MPTITEPQVYLKNKVEEQSFGKYGVERGCLKLRWRKARVQHSGSFLLIEHHCFSLVGLLLGKEKILRVLVQERSHFRAWPLHLKRGFLYLFSHTVLQKSYGWKMMSPDSCAFSWGLAKLSIFLYCYLYLLSLLCERTVHIL